MKKRVLSALLTLCMMLTMAPVAFAEEVTVDSAASLQSAIESASSGDTITLGADMDISESGLTIPSGKSLTLDLNGTQLKAANTEKGRITVCGSLIIRDSSGDQKNGGGQGKIYTETDYTGKDTGYGLIVASGETAMITLESGYINAVRDNASSKGQFALGVEKGGDITVAGGKVEAGWYAISGNGTNATQNSVIDIEGGELISTADYAIYLPQSGTTNISGGKIEGAAGGISMQRGTLNISGAAEIISKGTGDTGSWGDGTGGQSCAALNAFVKYGDCTVNISGGKLRAESDALVIATGTTYKANISISGGEFSSDVSEYVAADYTCTEDSGTYTVSLKDKITVATDSTTSGTVSATVGGATIDTDKDEISADDNTLTIDATDSGASDITTANVTMGGVAMNTIKESNYTDMAITTNVGTLTVSEEALATIVDNATTAGTTSDVTLSITVKGDTETGGSLVYTLTAEDANGNEVYGKTDAKGTIKVTVPFDGTEKPAVFYLPENGSPEKVADEKVELDTENDLLTWTVEHFSDYLIQNADTVAFVTDRNGTKEYNSLSEAIQNAQANATVTLASNIELSATGVTSGNGACLLNIDKSLTIDGQGKYTIKGVGFTEDQTNIRLINVTKGAGVIFKNLTLDGNNIEGTQQGARHGLNVWQAGKVELQNVTIKNCDWYAVVNNGSELIVNGLTTENNTWGINLDTDGSAIINDAAISEKSSVVYENVGQSTGSLVINDGTFKNIVVKAENTGETCGGEIKLTGGSFEGITTEGDGDSNVKTVVKVTGGTYQRDVSDYLATGMAWDNETGDIVPAPNSVASIGNKGFATLKEAITAANGMTNASVVLLKDATLDSSSAQMDSDVTLFVSTGATLSVEALNKLSGTLEVQAGGVLKMPNSDGDLESFVGSGTDARLNLTKGSVTMHGTQIALLKGSAATIPSEKGFFLQLGSGNVAQAMTAKIETGATLTVEGKLTVVNDSKLTVDGTLSVAADGIVRINSKAAVEGSGAITNHGVIALMEGATDKATVKPTITLASANGVVYSQFDIDKAITIENVKAETLSAPVKVDGVANSSETATPPTFGYKYSYYVPSSSTGGGGGGAATYSVSTSSTTNGTISVSSKSAAKDATVTITVKPNDGYVLDTLTVKDADGNAISVTKVSDTEYTFKMPASKVTISASFTEQSAVSTNPFIDVASSDYYYDAVLWAVENGITNGTSATTFSPNEGVTRAQMVTFLWRAAGSPKATATNPFTDIQSGDYYYDAVLWAVANGVTNGTSATTFSPETAVSRAQAVTFQWRAAGSPVVSGDSFADVAADAYYADAVTWAVENEITNGMSATSFGPDVTASRAQAVTFLYRAAN